MNASAPPPELTPAEMKLIAVVRRMDPESGRYVMAIAVRMAEKLPRTRPLLRIVTGGKP
jgi:hypothetical protein